MNKLMVNDSKNMRGLPPMPKTVSSSEAKSKFGEIVKWSTENKDEVIVKLYGEPAVVMMPYSEYEQFENLHKRKEIRKAHNSLMAYRTEVIANRYGEPTIVMMSYHTYIEVEKLRKESAPTAENSAERALWLGQSRADLAG
jgi:prevent-host-death family protein